jgi:hypothetical protein
MELTPERKQQIEEEERARLAEEHYRAQVRASLNTTASQSAPPPPEGRKSHVGLLLLIFAIGILAIVLVGAAIVLNSNARSTDSDVATPRSARGSSAPSVRYVPMSQKIATGQVVVKAHGFVQYRFQITPNMRDARISGSFNASGGSGNDVDAVIAAESEYPNWINGHQARVFYGTQGRKTTDSFDVRLGPGTYYFALSNRFSAFSDKYVFLNVDLNYSKMETY